jgi:glycosyltransferase involved in cell wall biosynthesis
MIKSLSIIFPVFNEESRLKSSFRHITSFLEKKKKLKIEIIFVDKLTFLDCDIKSYVN